MPNDPASPTVIVSSGIVSRGLVISEGGFLAVLSGGTVIDTRIVSGGFADVSSGATARHTVVGSGELQVEGVAIGTVVHDGGHEYLLGTDSDARIVGGFVTVEGSADLDSAMVAFGGEILTYDSSARVDNAVVRQGGFAIVAFDGRVDDITVDAGGGMVISSGGAATGQVLSGGVVAVLPGAVGSGLTAASGARVVSTGVVTLLRSGSLAGAVADGARLGGNDAQYVMSGGLAERTLIGSGTAQYLFSGGTASGTVIDGGAQVVSGGLDLAPDLRAGVIESVGATTSGAILAANTSFYLSGGTLETTSAAGIIVVTSASVTNTTLAAGGDLIAQFDATIDNTVIGAGSQLYLYPPAANGIGGNSVTGTTIQSGGTLKEFSGSYEASGTVVQVGGRIDLYGFAYSSGGTATVRDMDRLQIKEGSQQTTLLLAGNYSGDTFTLANDGAGYTLVTLSSEAQAAGAAMVRDIAPVVDASGWTGTAAPAHHADDAGHRDLREGVFVLPHFR